jgi:threonine/homoserine/homoserine lactone efflux protein
VGRTVAVPGSRVAGGRAGVPVRDGACHHLLNPKIAFMYVSLLPQFISPDHGSVLVQSLALGPHPDGRQRGGQWVIAIMAGSIAAFLAARPTWAAVQRWITTTVLCGLTVCLATEARR